MGNASSGSARRKLGDAIQTRVFQRSLPTPLTPEEQGEEAASVALQHASKRIAPAACIAWSMASPAAIVSCSSSRSSERQLFCLRCAAARVAAVMNRLAEREQERLQHLPSMEQVHARDEGLGLNLNKLVASISGRLVDVTGGQQAARQQVS